MGCSGKISKTYIGIKRFCRLCYAWTLQADHGMVIRLFNRQICSLGYARIVENNRKCLCIRKEAQQRILDTSEQLTCL